MDHDPEPHKMNADPQPCLVKTMKLNNFLSTYLTSTGLLEDGSFRQDNRAFLASNHVEGGRLLLVHLINR